MAPEVSTFIYFPLIHEPKYTQRFINVSSSGSYEQSPRFVEAYGDALDHEQQVGVIGSGENQLREDLAEAMLETSSTPHRVTGTSPSTECHKLTRALLTVILYTRLMYY